MREFRSFELAYREPSEAWRVAGAQTLQVLAGELWLTIDGDPADYWLRPGDTFALPDGTRARISAGRAGARFVLAFDGRPRARVWRDAAAWFAGAWRAFVSAPRPR